MTPHREACLIRRMRRKTSHKVGKTDLGVAPVYLNRKQRRALASAQLARKEDASGKALAKQGKVTRDGTLLLKVSPRYGMSTQTSVVGDVIEVSDD